MQTGITSMPTGAGVSIQAGTNRGLADIAGDDFINILVKQLEFQDPFKPMSNEEMIAQLSTIRELEMNTRLSQTLQQVTDQQRFGSAASLIGRFVRGNVADDEGMPIEISGIVKAIRFTADGEVMLELDDGDVLPLAKLEEVMDPT